MPASVTPKFQRYNVVSILDGTDVAPLEYPLTQWEGVFSYTEPQPAASVAYNLREFSAVVKGQEQVGQLSFTVNLKAFTLVGGVGPTVAELLDVLNFRPGTAWENAVSTGAASFTNFNMVDVKFDLSLGVTHGEEVNPSKTFHKCRYVSDAVSPGDPNTQVITMEVYGGSTDEGQDDTP
ncbi:MAG TPA: hypothetical protein ENL11_05960 [Candidatus Acetothermia bacterium]|nr:hypothetical protein [Candidatus Acetothermia bacterium]